MLLGFSMRCRGNPQPKHAFMVTPRMTQGSRAIAIAADLSTGGELTRDETAGVL